MNKPENLGGYKVCEESQHSSYACHFSSILRSNFFPDFLKEIEVHILFMNDDKVKYDPKCDASFPRGPVDHCQFAENLCVSYHETHT